MAQLLSRFHNSRRYWWWAGLLAAAGLLGFFFFRPAAVRVVQASGTVEGIEVQIVSKIPGRIVKLCCREGDSVRAGDLVVQLESEDLKAAMDEAAARIEKAEAEELVAQAAVAAARAELASAEAEIASAAAEVRRAQAQEEEAARNRDRYTALHSKGAVARAAYDAALTGFATAAAGTGAARARLVAVQAKRDSAAAQLAAAENRERLAEAGRSEAEAGRRYAEAKWGDTAIRSPMEGMVAFLALEEGETVAPGVTVLTLVDQQRLFARIDLDERLVGQVTVGGVVTLTAESLPGEVFQGTIAEISRYGEFATQRDVVRGRQDLRTFRVKIDLDGHGGRLKPGMTVEVTIPARGADDRRDG